MCWIRLYVIPFNAYCTGERASSMTNSMPEYGASEDDVLAGAGAAAAAATPLAAAAVSVISDLDDSLQLSCTLPPVDDEMQSVDTTGEFLFVRCVSYASLSVLCTIGATHDVNKCQDTQCISLFTVFVLKCFDNRQPMRNNNLYCHFINCI